MFISRLIIKSLTSLRLLGHMISEINGKNWLDSHCKCVMLEMSLEMRNTQYILGLANGMLHLLSLSSLCSFFFLKDNFSFLFYLFAQTTSRLWIATLTPSKLQMLTASLFAPLLIWRNKPKNTPYFPAFAKNIWGSWKKTKHFNSNKLSPWESETFQRGSLKLALSTVHI